LSFIAKLLSKKKEETRRETWEEKLEELGISVEADRQLAERKVVIKEISFLLRMPEEEFLKWLEKKENKKYDIIPENLVHALIVKLHALNNIIILASEPYARAGDNPRFAELLQMWHTMYWWTYEICMSQLKRMQTTKTAHKYVSFYQMRTFLYNQIFPRGETVIAICYKTMDVTPTKAIVIQQFASPATTPLIPGAIRPPSEPKPPEENIPSKLPKELPVEGGE